MDIIFTILGCLLISFVISGIIFGIISSRNYKEDFNKSLIISTIVIAIAIFSFNSLSDTKILENDNLKTELEELETENSKLTEETNDLQSQLDDLQNEYEYSQELTNLLIEQLESYGIEPYEL